MTKEMIFNSTNKFDLNEEFRGKTLFDLLTSKEFIGRYQGRDFELKSNSFNFDNICTLVIPDRILSEYSLREYNATLSSKILDIDENNYITIRGGDYSVTKRFLFDLAGYIKKSEYEMLFTGREIELITEIEKEEFNNLSNGISVQIDLDKLLNYNDVSQIKDYVQKEVLDVALTNYIEDNKEEIQLKVEKKIRSKVNNIIKNQVELYELEFNKKVTELIDEVINENDFDKELKETIERKIKNKIKRVNVDITTY